MDQRTAHTANSFAPTSIDRLLVRLQRLSPQLSRLSDGLMVAFAALLAVFDLFAALSNGMNPDRSSIGWLLSFGVPALGVSAVAAVAVRRRYCVQGLVAIAVLSLALTTMARTLGINLLPSFAALFALALLTARALRVESGGVAVAVTALAGLAVAAEPTRTFGSGAVFVVILCLGCFGVAVAAGVYLRWSDWRRLVAEDAARSDERLEIARELHDLVGHYVTGMVVQAQAGQHVARENPVAAAEALGRIEVAGGEAMTAMRRLIGGLRDDPTTTPGAGWDDIDLLGRTAVRDGLPLKVVIDDRARTLPLDLSSSIHRILAESLTNVRRHGRDVTAVDVSIGVDVGTGGRDEVTLRVHDDGLSEMPASHDTYGLVGMRERAEALGGTLYAGPGPSGGWLVHAVIPIGPER